MAYAGAGVNVGSAASTGMTGAHAGPGWGRAVSSRHGTVMVRWFAAIGKRRRADGQLAQLARRQVAQRPGPMAARTRRSGCPTLAVMRRTWRFLPRG